MGVAGSFPNVAFERSLGGEVACPEVTTWGPAHIRIWKQIIVLGCPCDVFIGKGIDVLAWCRVSNLIVISVLLIDVLNHLVQVCEVTEGIDVSKVVTEL